MASVKRLVRTIYSVRMQAALSAGQQWQPDDHTTANEALSIQQDAVLNTGQVPAIRYLLCGNGGITYTLGSDGAVLPRYLQHSPLDAMPFNIRPFVARPIDNDLAADQRARYALRRLEEHSGTFYWVYYAMRLDLTNVNFEYKRLVTVDGVTTPSAFVPTTDNLNPTPVDVPVDGAIITSSESVNLSGALAITLSADDVTEFLNAMEVLYGDTDHGFISEFAIASGVDRAISTYTGEANTPISFNEAIAVTTITHYVTNVSMDALNEGYGFTVNMGNGEPLLVVEDYTSAVVYS